jgi:hypothetical protein
MQLSSISYLILSLFVLPFYLFVCQFILDETKVTNVVVMSYIASSWNSFKTWSFHAYFLIQTWFTKKSWLCVGCYKSSSILYNKCFNLLVIWLKALGETHIYYLIFKICIHKIQQWTLGSKSNYDDLEKDFVWYC